MSLFNVLRFPHNNNYNSSSVLFWKVGESAGGELRFRADVTHGETGVTDATHLGEAETIQRGSETLSSALHPK